MIISFIFKDKIQKTKIVFFYCSYFNILDTYLTRRDKKEAKNILVEYSRVLGDGVFQYIESYIFNPYFLNMLKFK